MSRKLFFIGILLFFCTKENFVFSQKLISFLIADTQSKQTGKGNYANYNKFLNELDTVQAFSGLQRIDYQFAGSEFSKDKIMHTLQSMECSGLDVVLFYFSGSEYIGRSREVQGQALMVQDSFITIKEVDELLTAKKPRLFILLADLNNQLENNHKLKGKIEPAMRERYVSLFLKSKGKIIVSNHLPKEQFGHGITDEGSFFTHSFWQAIHEPTNPQVRWENIIARTRFFTVRHSYGSQNPQSKIDIQSEEHFSNSFNLYKTDAIITEKIKVLPNHTTNNPIENTQSSAGNKINDEVIASSQLNLQDGLSVEENKDLQQSGIQAIQLFQQTVENLYTASGDNAASMEKALLLFLDENREIEFSSLKKGIFRQRVRRYLQKVEKEGKEYRVNLSWYKPTQITEFKPDSKGNFEAKASIYQEYKKYKKEKLVYADRTEKSVQLMLKKQKNGDYKISIGHIKVVNTSPIQE